MPTRNESARRLKQARIDAGLTLREVSERSDGVYSTSRLGNFEQGIRRFKPSDAEALGSILGVSAAHLLCLQQDEGAGEMTPEELRLLRAFRALSEKDRHAELMHLEVMALPHRRPVSDGKVREAFGKPRTRRQPTP